MPQGIGATHSILGTQQTFGGMYFNVLDVSGSASYVAGGDSIGATSFGFNNTIWTLIGAVSQSGTYFVIGRCMNDGVSPWQLVWYVSATGAEVGAAVDLSAETVRLSALGY